MKKKIALSLIALVAVVGGVAAMSAYEAHVINVTAHIENALAVSTEAIEFGTVFPQEFVESDFTINLSESFLAAERVDDVEYVIKQKPKCICTAEGVILEECEKGEHLPVDYATHECPEYFEEMENLCPFLSKLPMDQDGNDSGVPSYYDDKGTPDKSDDICIAPARIYSNVLSYNAAGGWGGWSCPEGTYAVGGGVFSSDHALGAQGIAEPGATIGGYTYPTWPHYTYGSWYDGETGYVAQNAGDAQDVVLYVDCLAIVPDASGMLTKLGEDVSDTWTVDLKVPPVEGTIGQDWPATCADWTVPIDGTDYGCDLWIEVTGISE